MYHLLFLRFQNRNKNIAFLHEWILPPTEVVLFPNPLSARCGWKRGEGGLLPFKEYYFNFFVAPTLTQYCKLAIQCKCTV